MTEQKKVEREGVGAAETSHIAAGLAPARRRRLTAARKQEAVLRVLRGEGMELVARSGCPISAWQRYAIAARGRTPSIGSAGCSGNRSMEDWQATRM